MTEVTDKVIKGSSDLLRNTAKTGEGLLRGTAKTGEGLLRGTAKTGEGLLKGTADLGLGLAKDTGKLAKNTFKRTGKIAKRLLKGDIKGTIGSSGELVTGTFKEVVDDIEGTINTGLDNKYVSTTLKVLLAFYAAFAAPNLPRSIASLLDHTVVRILIAVLIVFLATKDASLAILVALAFVLSLQTANKYKLIDTSRSVSVPGKLTWLPSQQGSHHQLPHPSNAESHHTHNLHPVTNELPSSGHHIGDNRETAHGISRYNTTEHFTDSEVQPNNLTDNLLHNTAEHHLANDHATHAPAHLVTDESTLTQHHLTGHSQEASSHHPPHPEHVNMEHLPEQHETNYSAIQNNRIPGANQSSCAQSWSNENCPQGLNVPGGFDNKCGDHASF
jgi:hypothetical protein